MIKAIVFDFDGTILDSESSAVGAWETVYATFDCPFPRDLWAQNIGTVDIFDPFDYLVAQTGAELKRAEILAQFQTIHHAHLAQQPPMAGVLFRLAEAQTLGLALGLASSSSSRWLNHHLPRLGLLFAFTAVRGCDDVGGKRKPDPAVYLAACAGLGVEPQEALAIEDSMHGVMAAKQAGMYCTAVPNPITQHMDFSAADLLIPSLEAMTLAEMIQQLTGDAPPC